MKKKVDLPSGAELYRRLLAYVWPYKGAFFISVLAMVALATTDPLFAGLLKPIMDGGFVQRDPEFISLIPLLIVALFVVRGVAGFAAEYGMNWVGRKVIYDMRNQTFHNVIHLPTTYFSTHSSATLVSKLIYDVEQVAAAATTALTTVVKDGVSAIGLLGWMVYLNWKLTAFFLIIGPAIALFIRFMSRRFRVLSARIQDTVGAIAHVSKEAIQGERVLKVFGGHAYELAAFAEANKQNRNQAMKKAVVSSAGVPVVQMLGAVVLAGIVYIATAQSALGGVSVGEFVSYLGAVLLMMPPIRRLTKVNEIIQTGLAAAHSVFSLIDEQPETDSGKTRIKRAKGRVEYRDVCFRYGANKQRVLHDISFRIEPGQTVALVGASGSGKSTIASLLTRFYPVESGAILLDDVDVNDVRLQDLRANLAMVTQETILFDDTIGRNICYGYVGELPRKRLLGAARAAHVLEFVEGMPEGLETMIGERGVRLSGGQRQRIAIARALLKDAPILILDEATSSLDTESERYVQDAMHRLMAERTTLVIAHRLSTIEHAHQILVMKRGRIVETGTHQELIRLNGVYTRLHRTQFAEERSVN